jgi:hypothetical protein
LVTFTEVPSVSENGQVWVSVFTEFTDDFGVIEFVVKEEMLGILIGVNLNLGHGVVDGWDLDIFSTSFLKPVLQNSQFTSSFELSNELFHRYASSDSFKDLLDVSLITFQINQGSKHNRNGLWVFADLEKIHFNVL